MLTKMAPIMRPVKKFRTMILKKTFCFFVYRSYSEKIGVLDAWGDAEWYEHISMLDTDNEYIFIRQLCLKNEFQKKPTSNFPAKQNY